jgi:membrane protein
MPEQASPANGGVPQRQPRREGILRRSARVAWLAALQLVRHEGLELAGYAAFTALLSLFPSLLFLTALAGFFGDEAAAQQVVHYAFNVAPREVVLVLQPAIVQVLTQRHPDLLTLSILFALWSASSGVEALRTLLNRSYGLTETRPIWWLRAQSIVIVIFAALGLMALSALLLLAPLARLLQWVELRSINAAGFRYAFVWLHAFVWLLLVLLVMPVHLLLPNARIRLREVWPGSLVTATLWSMGAALFSIYVENFSNYSVMYGSLGGIILTLLFFDLSALIFAFGGELNAILGHMHRVRNDGRQRQEPPLSPPVLGQRCDGGGSDRPGSIRVGKVAGGDL